MIRTKLVGFASPHNLSTFGDVFPGTVELPFRTGKLTASNLDYDVPSIQPGTLLPGTR